MNKSSDIAVQLSKEKSRSPAREQPSPSRMKLLHKLALSAVAFAALTFATPAQAFWGRHVVYGGRVVVGYPYYYGYYSPAYYYPPAYYGYYGPYYGGVGFAFGGHGYYRGGGFRGGGFRGGFGGHGGHR